VHIRPFQPQDEAAVVQLWKECALAVQRELFLVGEVDGEVMASVMAGYEGHRGWVNYLAVAPGFRGRGYGRTLMRRVERLLLERGCPKLNVQVRNSNAEALAFYRRMGYLQDESVSLGKRLIADA
jgi:ribosomal protein S18 acetylase RimI-like enzyme